MTRWDVIVIGGGCNGLAAAALAVRGGRRTLLIEQRPHTGGLAATQHFGTGHVITGLQPFPTGATPDELKVLDLASHGLRPEKHTAPLRVFAPEGRTFLLPKSTGSLPEEFESEHLGYRRYRTFCKAVTPLLRAAFGAPMHNVSPSRVVRLSAGLWRCGLAPGRMLARVAPLSAQDFLNEFIANDALQGALTAPLLGRTWAGPWSPFGALQILLHEASGSCQIAGGTSVLARALHKAAEAGGVNVRTGQRAIRISDAAGGPSVLLNTGEMLETAAVIVACSPNVLYGTLLDPAQTGARHRMRSRGTCAVLALALDHLPDWGPVIQARIVPGMETMERAFDAVKHGRVPRVQALELHLNSKGPNVLSVHALQTPNEVRGGWSERARAELQEGIMSQLLSHLPELSGGVVTSKLWTPTELARAYALPGGHLQHFERDIDQLLRPPPVCPVPNVYWIGGAHAESGFICAGGVAAARAVLRK